MEIELFRQYYNYQWSYVVYWCRTWFSMVQLCLKRAPYY